MCWAYQLRISMERQEKNYQKKQSNAQNCNWQMTTDISEQWLESKVRIENSIIIFKAKWTIFRNFNLKC